MKINSTFVKITSFLLKYNKLGPVTKVSLLGPDNNYEIINLMQFNPRVIQEQRIQYFNIQ